MKSFLPFLSIILFAASCTTAYKSGQTPDDVYFSPQRPQDEYVRVDERRDRYRNDRYDDQNEDDRYLRMKIRNRRSWSELDYYYNDPLAYNYYGNRYNSFYYNTPWNSYNAWNYYYNPYYSRSYYNPYGPQVLILNPKAPVYNRPRQYNLNVYDSPNANTNNNNPKVYNSGRNNRVYDDSYSRPSGNSPRRDAGSGLRDMFGGSSNSSSSPSVNNSPSRIESSSRSSSNSSSSGSSSGSSGSNAPVRRF